MINGKRVLGLVPARGGSKGVPGKNILQIGGRPLIHWTISAALASRYIDRLILSSDDSAIIEAAVAAGCDVPFRRDQKLSGDEIPSLDVVVDALERVPGFDILVLLQPTSPLRDTQDIDGALELLISSGAPACVSIRPAEEHPYWTFMVDEQRHIHRYVEQQEKFPSRRQELPEAWCLNGAIYVAQIEWYLLQKSFISETTVGFPMPMERSIDIDTPADVERLRTIVANVSAGS